MIAFFVYVVVLVLSMNVVVFADDIYRNDKIGFSIDIPKVYEDEVEIAENEENQIELRYMLAAIAPWQGTFMTIEVVTPRMEFMTGDYDAEGLYPIKEIMVSEEALFFVRNEEYNAHETYREEYQNVGAVLSLEDVLILDNPDTYPTPDLEYEMPDWIAENPESILTFGELMVLLDDWNETENLLISTPMENEKVKNICAYFASYGIVPHEEWNDEVYNQEITRGEFIKTIHLFLYNPVTSWFGEELNFSDTVNHPLEMYLKSAYDKGWIFGYGDYTVKPDRGITHEEVMLVMERVLEMSV